MDTLEIFKKLKELNSTKQKVELLDQYKADKTLLKLLKAGLDKDRLFQFNKMPCKFNKKGPHNLDFLVSSALFLGLLSKLEDRVITGNEAKAEVKDVFDKLDKDTYDLFSKILCKKALGISDKTLNKVWPGAIEEFNPMLAPNVLPDLTNLDYPLFIQPKRDGYRCIFKEGKLYTRYGKEFKNNNLLRVFSGLNKAGQYVLDGELYMHGKTLEQHTEILNAHEAPIPPDMKFYVFDVIPVADWNKESYSRPYKDRIRDVRVVCTSLIAEPRRVVDVHTEEIQSAGEAVEKYKNYLTNGYEGAMIRDKEGLYRWKRVTINSGELIKLKPKETVDVQVVEIYAGKDNFEGMAGGFHFNTDNGTSCSVGSGFTLSDRKAMAENPTRFVGKTAEIAIMGRTKTGSYRDPRFKRWRPDKDK
jgi:hypothetical protein